MNTLRLNGLTHPKETAQQAGALLKAGKLVAFPTETVYGLGADATNQQAVEGIFTAKGRPQDNPLIVHLPTKEAVDTVAKDISPKARKLMDAFWPGPLTLVLWRKPCIPAVVSAGLDTVAVRVPNSTLAREILTVAGTPVAAPSANRSGRPSPTTADHVLEDLDGSIDAVVLGESAAVGLESTVVDMTREVPVLLRPGGVTLEELEAVVGTVTVSSGVLEKLSEDAVVPSPGMKYRHYAPQCKVVLLKGREEDFLQYVADHSTEGVAVLYDTNHWQNTAVQWIPYGRAGDVASQSKALFSALRQLDDLGATVAYVPYPKREGMGLALENRLLRAAGFEVIEL